MTFTKSKDAGSTLVVTIIVVFVLLILLGTAVDYSTQISRATQRSRKTALAMEIADGHLEYLFSSWRNIYRTTYTTVFGTNTGGTDYSLVGTNYFFTSMYNPGPAPTPVPSMTPSGTPPTIPLPASSNFPTEANYNVTQYRIQAVDPMIDLDTSGNALKETSNGSGSYTSMPTSTVPPAGFGPNQVPAYSSWLPGGFPYSYYYLASVDVTVPALTGTVTAKVRRVFEKKFDLPWSYMMFWVDDLELQPTAALSVSGPLHTNGSLYIGTSNFSTSARCEYATYYVNGYSPNDSRYGNSATAPSFAKSDPSLTLSDCPPYQTSPYLPFGWSLNFNPLTANTNDGYHEIIERPAASPSPDPLASVRMYTQAGLRVLIDSAGNITATFLDGTSANGGQMNTIKNFVSTGSTSNSTLASSYVMYDNREGGYIKVTNVDVYQLAKNVTSLPQWNGVMYISDTSATLYNTDGTVKTAGTAVNVTYTGSPAGTYSTTKRAIRLINAAALPSGGLTLVTDNPVYIVGDFNIYGYPAPTSAATPSATPPTSYPTSTPASDNGTYTTRIINNTGTNQPAYAAVMCDAITLLSKNWTDTNSTGNVTPSSRWGYNTTVNTCVIAGQSPSSGGTYGGGGENYFRFLEDWSKNSNTFTFYGSMVQLYRPQQAIGAWTGSGNLYKAPALKWYYDSILSEGIPPGYLDVAAYLQQQRWYQVY